MKAVKIDQYGDERVLQLVEVPTPEPAPHEVLIQVQAASVNPVDWKIRDGAGLRFGMQLPIFLGSEVAGVVAKVGADVTEFRVGDEVYGTVPAGGYADYALAQPAALAPKPAALDFAHAAAIPLAALTAWQALFEAADLRAGQRVLILGAAGSVGALAVQLAKAKGASVTGLASGGNEAFVRSLGADEFVDYTAQPFEDVVSAMDVVLDAVGGDTFTRALRCVKKGGILVTVVAFPTPEQGAGHGIRAVRVASRPNRSQLDEISQLVAAGQLVAQVAQTFPLAQVGAAQELSKAGHTRGKLVLLPGSGQ